MKYQARELLVIAKVAEHWQEDFEQKVDELINIVSKVDTENNLRTCTETLDVYHKSSAKPAKKARKRKEPESRPFAFLVFSN